MADFEFDKFMEDIVRREDAAREHIKENIMRNIVRQLTIEFVIIKVMNNESDQN